MVSTSYPNSDQKYQRTADEGRRTIFTGLITMKVVAMVLATVSILLIVDAIVQPIAPFDIWVMNLIQSIDFTGLATVLATISLLTSTSGAITTWTLLLVAFIVTRKWLPVLAILALPIGGLINNIVGNYLVSRSRPDDTDFNLIRTVSDINAPSFPSGHVMGAVMLFGLLFFLATTWQHRSIAIVDGQ